MRWRGRSRGWGGCSEGQSPRGVQGTRIVPDRFYDLPFVDRPLSRARLGQLEDVSLVVLSPEAFGGDRTRGDCALLGPVRVRGLDVERQPVAPVGLVPVAGIEELALGLVDPHDGEVPVLPFLGEEHDSLSCSDAILPGLETRRRVQLSILEERQNEPRDHGHHDEATGEAARVPAPTSRVKILRRRVHPRLST